MNETALVISMVFHIFGIAMFIALTVLVLKLRRTVDSLQPSLTSMAAKVEKVADTVNTLTQRVDGITTQVSGIADAFRGVADAARTTVESVGETAQSAVRNVGSRAEAIVNGMGDRAEESMQTPKGSQVMSAVLMGLQVYNAIRGAKEHTNGKMPDDPGTMDEHRGVEQSGSSSGS